MEPRELFFDIEKLANDYRISKELLESIITQAHSEFGDDHMMAELHALRAVRRLGLDTVKKVVDQ